MAIEGMIGSIRLVTGALDAEGVPYAVTGSVASSIHGEPITSIDVDIVVLMTPDQAPRFAGRMAPRFYADAETLRRAALDHSITNILDQTTGLKFDISVLAETPYHQQLFQRRIKMAHPDSGVTFWIVSPEDIVLMKLLRRRDTRSRKQWDNALSVVRVQGSRLDWAYLRKWARQLSIEGDLEALAREAGI